MKTLEQKILDFAHLIIESKRIVALTGAGMSTESGIPDFRSPGSGLWTRIDPGEFASFNSYVSNTTKNLGFMFELGMTIFRAKPNKGHKALTRLQKLGKLEGVLTQNIDGLHQRARTTNVIELHGTANEAICIRCKKIYPITTMINQFIKEKITPICPECKDLLKPNAIFFGEALESDVLVSADKMLSNCDLLIILGSSLLVYPVAFYPKRALAEGAKVCIINIQETDIDENCEVIINEKIGESLPKIVEIVEKDF